MKLQINRQKMIKVAQDNTSLWIFLVLGIILGIFTKGGSLRFESIENLLIAEAVRSFAAFGVGLIILTKGIDLSIGQVLGFAACVAASLSQTPTYTQAMYPGLDLPWFIPVIAATMVGGFFGLANGLMVSYGKIPPFIASLGTMSIAWGCKLIYTQSSTLGSVKQSFKQISQGKLGPVPYLIIYIVILFILISILLKYTRFGKFIYAIGGNIDAAKVSGINVLLEITKVYTLAGILYGIAGALQAARLGLADPLTGNYLELDAIAAVTVGGISHAGGIGKARGMILGVLILGLINFGMTYMGIDPSLQLLVKGFIIVTAVYFDMRKNK